MSMNILNDISSVYLEQVVIGESSHLEPDMKKRRENNEKAIFITSLTTSSVISLTPFSVKR